MRADSFLLLLATLGGCANRRGVVLYVYDCAGQVLKLDASGRTVAGRWQLQSEFQTLVPPGNRDGCYLNGLVYEKNLGRFLTAIPKQPVVSANGARDHLLVAADVPAMRVAASMALPQPSATAPALTLKNDTVAVRYEPPGATSQEMVALYAAADLHPIGGPMLFQPAADPLASDSRYSLAKVVAEVDSLRLLVFPEEAGHQRRFSVVRGALGEMVASFTVGSTSVRNVHLSLDGRRVLVEALSPDTQALTGRLLLYDLAQQRQIRTITAPELANADAQFLCIPPSLESALYSRGRRLNAVNLTTGAVVAVAPAVVVDKTNICLVADR